MKRIWVRGGRCLSCGRRWQLRRVAKAASAEIALEPIQVRAPWTAAPEPKPDDLTRFDLIRHHPYLP